MESNGAENGTQDWRVKAGSIGGKHRVAKMTHAELSEAGRKAAQARWGLLRADYEGILELHGIKIPSAVLSDGTRVLSRREFMLAIGRNHKSELLDRSHEVENGIETFRPNTFLGAQNLEPFITKEIREKTKPIEYKNKTGEETFGYDATLLADVCDVYLDAKEAGVLRKDQQHIADRCVVLMRGFARIGIIALVDEATGYQKARSIAELREKLNAFLADELQPYQKIVPDEFYQHLFRLRGWHWNQFDPAKGPRKAADYTVDLIYQRMEEGLTKELYARTPRVAGHLDHKMHQHLSENGRKRFLNHVYQVIGAMKQLPTPHSQKDVNVLWRTFLRGMDRFYPRRLSNVQQGFDFKDDVAVRATEPEENQA